MHFFLRKNLDKNRTGATMGDEDWEAEIIKPHASSYVPVFEKVVKFKVCGC